jgi:P22 coat protein - gene protein 5
MALTQIQGSVFSAKLLMALQKNLVIASPRIVNGDYQIELSADAKEAYISGLADVSVQNYSKYTALTIEQLADTRLTFPLDQQKAFAAALDDIDKIQSKPDVMQAVMNQAGYQLVESADSYLGGLHAGATSIGAALTITSTNVFTRVLSASTLLDMNNVPRDNRFLILSPQMLEFLVQNSSYQAAANDAVIEGSVSRFLGFDVYVSNNIAKTGTSPTEVHHCLAGSPIAWTFASQIQQIESVRRHDMFVDVLKGLYVFGGKIVRPVAIADLMMQR